MNRLTHHQATILIHPMTVITDASGENIQATKKSLIKLCTRLTAKLLTTAHKYKIIRFKVDEDPLQPRIYFLAFVESLEMIFHNTQKLVK